VVYAQCLLVNVKMCIHQMIVYMMEFQSPKMADASMPPTNPVCPKHPSEEPIMNAGEDMSGNPKESCLCVSYGEVLIDWYGVVFVFDTR